MRCKPMVGVLAVLTGAGVAAGAEPGPDVYELQCSPVRTIWPVPEGWERSRSGPALAVVDTHVRPKRTRLVLDGRFVGTAKSFDGSPDYLYLRPGRYRLQARLGGYRTAEFEIDARPGCRFDIRHRMERVRGAPKEGSLPAATAGPVQRVWQPTAGGQPKGHPRQEAPPRGGPDLVLRPDLGRLRAQEAEKASTLQLKVEPAQASVYLDGDFVATGAEIAAMQQPLSIQPGSHVLEVVAPGYHQVTTRFSLSPDESRTVEIVLVPDRAQPPGSSGESGPLQGPSQGVY